MPEPRKLLTTQEAGERLNLSPDTIKNYFNSGKLGGFKLPSGVYRIFKDEVDRMMGV